MFIHDLDETDNMRAKESVMLGLPHKSIFSEKVMVGDREIDGKQLKWSVFHDFSASTMYATVQEWVFPFIKNLHDDSRCFKKQAECIEFINRNNCRNQPKIRRKTR